MKKILIIPSWYPSKDKPGLGTFFREQAALFEDDFDLRVLAGHLNKNVSRVKKLRNSMRFALLKKTSVQQKDNYFLAPPEVYGFEYSQGMNKLKKANFQLKIEAFLSYFKQNILPVWKPDLIHAQNTNISGIVARHLSERFHIPYIITDHHHVKPNSPSFIREEIRNALLQSKKNCFVSEWQYRTYLLLDYQIKGEVVGNLLDEDVFRIQNRTKKGPFTIIHVSNGLFWKDTETLAAALDIFANLKGGINEIKIWIIGMQDEITRSFIQKVKNNELKSKIEFINQVPHNELSEYYVNSDVFVYSSAFESFGLTPIEAMLCGVPVVATSNGGIDEYIKEGVNGIKVPLKDAKGLAQGLLEIYIGKRKFNPEKVRQSVIDKFNREKFLQKMTAIYKEAIL